MKTNLALARRYILLLCSLSLGACTTFFSPQFLGISEKEWQSYSPKRQRELENIYHEQARISAQKTAIQKHVVPSKGKIPKKSAHSKSVTVYVFGGKVIMPPFTEWFPYKAKPLSIDPGDCSEGLLVSSDAKILSKGIERPRQIALKVCYKNGILLLDPSRYDSAKKNGTLRIHYSPLWEQGLTYNNISTSGYARLKNANIRIGLSE